MTTISNSKFGMKTRYNNSAEAVASTPRTSSVDALHNDYGPMLRGASKGGIPVTPKRVQFPSNRGQGIKFVKFNDPLLNPLPFTQRPSDTAIATNKEEILPPRNEESHREAQTVLNTESSPLEESPVKESAVATSLPARNVSAAISAAGNVVNAATNRIPTAPSLGIEDTGMLVPSRAQELQDAANNNPITKGMNIGSTLATTALAFV